MKKLTETETHTYMRDPVPAKNNGQCPCCLKNHRSTKRGTMIRHGWKETGRRVGQLGSGFQWGNCRGWNKRPLEQTDADALVILAELEAHLAEVRASLTHHETNGEASYDWTHSERLDYSMRDYKWVKTDTLETVLTDLGLTVTTREDKQRMKGHRVYYVPVKVWEVKVPQGSAGAKVSKDKLTGESWDSHYTAVTVPSYDDLRDRYVVELRSLVKRLEEQREAIKAAIKHHYENPSKGSKDTKKRGPVVHWRRTVWRSVRDHDGTYKKVEQKVLACASRGMAPVASENKAEVTCSRCLKRAKREER